MTERPIYLWVHRRHADYPGIGTGFQWCTPQEADDLVKADCAQHSCTDSRVLHHISKEPPYKPQVATATKISRAEESEETPVEAPKKPAARRRYKRRDMTAEQP